MHIRPIQTADAEHLMGLNLALYERQGFQREGRRVAALRIGGEWVDEFYMAKLLSPIRESL